MCHIHTYIVYTHLATRGNNKILSTPPPHISSSEEILPHFTRRTHCPTKKKYITLSKIILTEGQRQITYTPLFPLCNSHIHNTHNLFNCTKIHTTLSPLDLWRDPAGVTTPAGQMDGEASW